jgi:hypothetical protein
MKRWLTAPILMTLALLAGSEIIVRVFFARNMSGRFEYGYNPTAGFVEHANGTVSLVRAGGRRFHPQTFSRARLPGTYRVMVVGDSVPRGSSLESSYPRLIGEKLPALGIKAESFNLAVAGNGALRSQIVVRKALDYEPSLVILHVNNSNEFEDEREFKRAEEFKSWHPRNWLMKSLIIRRLYEAKTEQVFWKLVPAEVRDRAAVSDADAEVRANQNPEVRREWDERVRKYTAETVALARARGVAILLLTQAGCEHDASGRVLLDSRGLDEMVQPLSGDGVYFLSMKQNLQDTDFVPLFSDGTHLRPAGHERIADAVVKKLFTEKLVAAGKGG